MRKLEGDARAEGAGTQLPDPALGRQRQEQLASPGWPTASPACTTRNDQKVFDSVVVITDRRVLDQQLQDTIYQFEHKQGVVQKIDEDSDATGRGARSRRADHHHDAPEVPVRHREGRASCPKRRYAVIVDEAHSSQIGRERQPS